MLRATLRRETQSATVITSDQRLQNGVRDHARASRTKGYILIVDLDLALGIQERKGKQFPEVTKSQPKDDFGKKAGARLGS